MATTKAKNRRTGRPSKIEEPVRKLLVEGVRMGLSIDDAVIWACGQGQGKIAKSTIYEWLKRKDEAGEAFRTDLSHARVHGSVLRLAQIMEAARTGRVTRHYDADGRVVREVQEPGDWRAASWLQSKLHPEGFGGDSNPLYLLHRLRGMAEAAKNDDERAAWQHLMDTVARSLGKLKPFGAAAKLPDEEADEAELSAELQGEGVAPEDLPKVIEAFRILNETDRRRGVGPGHGGNGTAPSPGPAGNGTPPPPQRPPLLADWVGDSS